MAYQRGVMGKSRDVRTRNEWYTPGWVIEAARGALGGIELDPASSALANETVRADRYFTIDQDGLAQDWKAETVWINPPYGHRTGTSQFMLKLLESFEAGTVDRAIMLTRCDSTTRAFSAAMARASALAAIKERLHFWSPHLGKSSSTVTGNWCVAFGVDPRRLATHFGDRAAILVPWNAQSVFFQGPDSRPTGVEH